MHHRMFGSVSAVLIWGILLTMLRGAAAHSGETLTGVFSLQSLFPLLLERNGEIGAQTLEEEISTWAIKAERGIFEPVFTVDWSYNRGERVNTQEEMAGLSFGGLLKGGNLYEHRNIMQQVGISGLLPSGAEYSLGCSFNRLENTVNSFKNEYDAFAGVELRQPLLRNFGRGIPNARIRLAMKEYEIQHQYLRKRIGEVVVVAEQTYWDLRLKYEQVRMRQESAARAERMLRDFRERLEAGKASSLDVYQAETGLSLRQAQVETARQQFFEAANNLRSLLAETATDMPVDLIPGDSLAYDPLPVDGNEALAAALATNPDYLALLRQIEQDDIRIEVAQDALQPQLDAVGSFGLNANGRDVPQTTDQFESRDYETWSLGVQLRVPLGGGRRARSELAATRLRKQQKAMRLRDLQVQLQNRLATVKGRFASLSARLASLENAVAFNERLLDVALVRLNEGKDDIRHVLSIEEDLVEARDNRLRTLLECREAMLDWEYIQGIVLEQRGMSVAMLVAAPR